ncbi:MAG: GNAT family N-acetyltransferase [Bdellovibrionales bacterium]
MHTSKQRSDKPRLNEAYLLQLTEINDLDGYYELFEQVRQRSTLARWSKKDLYQSIENREAFQLSNGREILAGLIARSNSFETEIFQVFVSPRFLRRGLATTTLELYLKDHCVRPSKIFLEVEEGNVAAIGLYKKIGFIFSHIRKKYYKNGESAHVFELNIGK